MRDLKSQKNIERVLGRQRPALKKLKKRFGGPGSGFFVAGLLFLSALVISSLLPVRKQTPRSPERQTSPTAGVPRVAESLSRALLHPSHRLIHGSVRRGQTFAQALTAEGLSPRLTHEIARALRPHLNFRKIRPGATFQASLNASEALLHFVYRASPLEIYEVTRTETGYRAVQRVVPVERRVERVAGKVTSSLFESMEALGERPELTLRFVNIFLWDFDFNSSARPGDEFRLLVEKEYSGDTLVRYGKILIAQYENRGKTHTGIYFEARRGTGDFYTPNGRSVRKTFLRSPLRFTRISSRYTHRRRHPILGGVRPHLAVDYAARPGTPVWAVADGVVLSAGWNRGNGKSILIRHRGGYRTMYNHLSRFARRIRRGTRVRQKQVIGYVGSTGLSTGPHLDYRVIKNGHFVNPLRQKFIPGDPIPRSQRARFRRLRDRLLQKLQSPELASAK
ncbi:MAG: peptidoglycan DD-metalloendopeptidase family protein [Candidatus Methylomirabilales bacterium]